VGQHSNGQTRYFCGSRETTAPCQHAASIREDRFLPWVEDFMTGLENGQLEALLARERGLRLHKPLIAKESAAGAIENIDRRIKNMNIKLDSETVTPAEFKAEIESLRRQRRIYEAQLGEQPNPRELEGLAARWRKGDEQDRHELLSALFEKLHVANGQIFGCTPRGDRVNRVRLLLGTTLDYVADSGGQLPEPEVVLYAEGEGPWCPS